MSPTKEMTPQGFLLRQAPTPNKKKRKKGEEGQILIEFIFALIFMLSLFVLFLNYALSMASGYVIHYATYMGSRTFLVYDIGNNEAGSDNAAIEKSKQVFDSFNLKSGTLKFNLPGATSKSAFVGSYYTYQKNIAFLMFIGKSNPSRLISESFIGREPVRSECLKNINEKIRRATGSIPADHKTLFDNGC